MGGVARRAPGVALTPSRSSLCTPTMTHGVAAVRARGETETGAQTGFPLSSPVDRGDVRRPRNHPPSLPVLEAAPDARDNSNPDGGRFLRSGPSHSPEPSAGQKPGTVTPRRHPPHPAEIADPFQSRRLPTPAGEGAQSHPRLQRLAARSPAAPMPARDARPLGAALCSRPRGRPERSPLGLLGSLSPGPAAGCLLGGGWARECRAGGSLPWPGRRRRRQAAEQGRLRRESQIINTGPGAGPGTGDTWESARDRPRPRLRPPPGAALRPRPPAGAPEGARTGLLAPALGQTPPPDATWLDLAPLAG
ncbi:translation initiation factor IF-2-like [Meles meles]|uniref:translation initiation factor IF-2-like n=1 Tax=Meles meles TaxID=9662 RepID=UPI001E69FABA|nr:translation initiation factor IF-2-like [Meles meles]